MTLTGPSTGTTGVASSNFTVGLNGTAPGGLTITMDDAGDGGTFTPTTLSGAGTFTYTAATDGAKSIGITDNQGLTDPADVTYTASAPVAAGAWQQLTFPAIMRRPVSTGEDSGFDPAHAIAQEVLSPVSTAVLPFRAFCRPSIGEPGVLYYQGSLHSDYAGNEIDRIDLTDLSNTEVGLSINHQPVVPPQGPESGYSAGSSAYLYRQYDTGLADNADWQPYAFHNWCFNTWHPDHGYLLWSNYAVANGATTGADPAGSGSGFVQSAQLYYSTPGDYRQRAFVRYYAETKYQIASVLPSDTLLGIGTLAGVASFSNYRQSTLAFFCNQDNIVIYELQGGVWSLLSNQVVATLTGIPGNRFANGKDSNGILVQALDQSRFLWMAQCIEAWPDTGLDQLNWTHQIYVYDAEEDEHTRVLLGSNIQAAVDDYLPIADLCVSFAVDRSARLVYCVTLDGTKAPGTGFITGTPRIWQSGFDDLATWTELSMTSSPTLTLNFAYNREPLQVFNGHLFLMSQPGGLTTYLHRVKVTQGENPPDFNFHRHDFMTQDYALPSTYKFMTGGKHVNWAYRSVDSRYYMMAGDVVESFEQSTCSLAISDSSYTFYDELDTLTPAPSGYVRPASPDDGAWIYCGASNDNAALADKFIYARGGDGLGLRSNTFMQGAYVDDAAAAADRWTLAKFTIYDPVNKRFTDAGLEAWTVSAGTDPIAHPSTWPANYCRQGCFDGTNNTMYRFAPGRLAAFNFDTETVRIWNASSWITADGAPVTINLDNYIPPAGSVTMEADATWPDMYYYDAPNTRYKTFGDFSWEHQGVWLNEADGKLYVVCPATGYLWCFETRASEATDGDGNLRIPFYPVGKRVPLNHFPGATWDVKGHSYLVPFKGGLLYTCDTISGNSGNARFAYWRRLGFAGDWTPITLPADWKCNTFAPKARGIDNDEFMSMMGHPMVAGGTPRGFYLTN